MARSSRPTPVSGSRRPKSKGCFGAYATAGSYARRCVLWCRLVSLLRRRRARRGQDSAVLVVATWRRSGARAARDVAGAPERRPAQGRSRLSAPPYLSLVRTQTRTGDRAVERSRLALRLQPAVFATACRSGVEIPSRAIGQHIYLANTARSSARWTRVRRTTRRRSRTTRVDGTRSHLNRVAQLTNA